MTPLRLLALNTLLLVGVHFAFHIGEWLWWPRPLESLLGAHELGRAFHATIEVLVVVVLVAVVVGRRAKL